MRLPSLTYDARPGETPREHVARLTSFGTPPWVAAKGLGVYVTTLLDRVDDLERRVAALEAKR